MSARPTDPVPGPDDLNLKDWPFRKHQVFDRQIKKQFRAGNHICSKLRSKLGTATEIRAE
jgi:hypothetical protein